MKSSIQPFNDFDAKSIKVVEARQSCMLFLLWERISLTVFPYKEKIDLFLGWPQVSFSQEKNNVVLENDREGKFLRSTNLLTSIERPTENHNDFDLACNDPKKCAEYILQTLEKRFGPDARARTRVIQDLTDLAASLLNPNEKPIYLHLDERLIDAEQDTMTTLPGGSLCSYEEIFRLEKMTPDNIAKTYKRLTEIDPNFGADHVKQYLGEAHLLHKNNTVLRKAKIFRCNHHLNSHHERMNVLESLRDALEPVGFRVDVWAKKMR